MSRPDKLIVSNDWFLKVVNHIELNKIYFGFADRQYLLGYINKKYDREFAKEIIWQSMQYSELFKKEKISEYLDETLYKNEYKIYYLLKANDINVNDFGVEFDFKTKVETKSELYIAPKINDGLLKVRTGNQCINDAKNKTVPKMLFSEFWHEGELSILFADTNVGKSILAVQMANAIMSPEIKTGS